MLFSMNASAGYIDCVYKSNWNHQCSLYRISIPQGWLVSSDFNSYSCITFIPDKLHEWKI